MSYFYTPPETKKDIQWTNIHLMVDIESMGVAIGSPIITIGAVLFDPRKQDNVDVMMKRVYLSRIDIEDAMKNSIGADPGTVKWWLNQEDSAIKALVTGNLVTMKQACEEFRQFAVHRWPGGDDKFFPNHSQLPLACIVWANSPDFDCKMLEYAFAKVQDVFPFKFFQYRCLRTIKDLAWPNGSDDVPRFNTGAKHDALADAANQALVVQAAYKQLGLSTQDVTMDKI